MKNKQIHPRPALQFLRLPRASILAIAGFVSLASLAQADEALTPVLTSLSNTTISGDVDTSFIWQMNNSSTSTGRSYDGAAQQNEFNLNVVKLSLEKPLDEGKWGAGYRVTLLAGPDANFATGGTSDFGIYAAYVHLRIPVGNDIDLKVGVFPTIVGYEAFDSYKNPNYSRSYGYYIEPGHQTGALATYQVNKWLGVQAGISDTYGLIINGQPPVSTADKTFMAGLSAIAPESWGKLKGMELDATVVDGFAMSGSRVFDFYSGLTVPTPLKGFSVVLAYDYEGADSYSSSGQPNYAAPNYANATGLYLLYQATPKLKFADRLEYASASTGFFGENTANKLPGTEQLFGDTFTVTYNLWANVLSRVELRWDHDLSARRGGAAAFGSGDTGTKNALSLSVNLVYMF